jgi:glutamate dehydrogenase
LNSDELKRLVKLSLPITEFNKDKLSRQGIVMAANTDEGMQRRNTMHFRVKADAFVPAGGRPNTTNITNWRQFLTEDGKASSPLMVEGANIFTTQEARELLFEHGKVAIVKDSSANKCGVMTSSYEVAASMLLSKEEFMPIKAEIVEDVLVRLRHVARLEADLLFREYYNYPGALPSFSERISLAIAKVTDAITDALANVNPEDALFQELFPIIKENLPTKLAEVAGDRIASRYPVQYQRNAIASGLASKIVYAEGVHLIEQQPQEHVASRAFDYYRADQKVQGIIRSLEKQDFGANAANKPLVIDILKKAGARASVDTL